MIAEVVLPIKIDRAFHYRVPARLRDRLRPGMRVVVPFRQQVKTGFVVGFAEKAEVPYLKDVRAVLDDAPLVGPAILRLTRWVADRTLCSWGTALNAAVPPGARRKSAARTIPYVEFVSPGDPGRSAKAARALEYLAAAKAPVPWRVLAARTGAGRANIDRLVQLGLARWKHVRRVPDLFSEIPPEPPKEITLTPEQQRALDSIHARIEGPGGTALLFGVTGSGKTEVYLRAMEHAARAGRASILLVPEVSLTPQSVARVRSRFERVQVLHSTLSEADRADSWRAIRRGEAQVVVGARSAVFAPIPNLGLIVLDEEHESTYKQEADPRYHARDVAIERARQDGATVVLGSATPSLESFHRARVGEFELLRLPSRVEGLPMPAIHVIDMEHEAPPTQSMPVLSKGLQEAVAAAAARGEQSILFLNRRGYATYARCRSCGWVARCPRCDSSLNFHRDVSRWQCHYCLADRDLPERCPKCQIGTLKLFGVGTQRVEEEAKKRFPGLRVGRMDSDAMKTTEDYRDSLQNLWRGDTDVLVGTQMIAKGLDVPRVTVVGVVSADTAFHVPDFRAAERTFQLVTQVAGRAGRSRRGGTVYVQTLHPGHPAIACAAAYDYDGFAERELRQREEAGYPPFTRLIRFVVEGRDEPAVRACSDEVGARLRAMFDPMLVLGPAPAPLGKIRDRLRRHLLLKCADLEGALRSLKPVDWRMPSKVSLTIDVDPQSLL
jgi:primosomal protein N' (replication factor Y)